MERTQIPRGHIWVFPPAETSSSHSADREEAGLTPTSTGSQLSGKPGRQWPACPICHPHLAVSWPFEPTGSVLQAAQPEVSEKSLLPATHPNTRKPWCLTSMWRSPWDRPWPWPWTSGVGTGLTERVAPCLCGAVAPRHLGSHLASFEMSPLQRRLRVSGSKHKDRT